MNIGHAKKKKIYLLRLYDKTCGLITTTSDV